MIPGRRYSVSSLLRLLWSRKLLIVAAVAIGAGGAAASVSRVIDAYQSEATILVLPQLVPQNYVRSTVTQDLEDQLRSLRDSVLATDRVVDIAKQLNLYPELGDDGNAIVERFRSRVFINITRPDAFRVAFVHRSPVQAARTTELLADAFVEENIRARAGLAQETDAFMEAQLQNTRDRLAEHEARLQEYRETYSGQLPTQMGSNLQVIQNAQVQLRALADTMHQEREQRLKIEQSIAALSVEPEPQPAEPEGPEIDFEAVPEAALTLRGRAALRQIPVARATLEKLELQLKEEHPDIIRLKRVISQLEQRVKTDLGEAALTGGPTGPDPARVKRIAQLQSEVAAIDKRLEAREREEAQLRDVIARYQQRVELIPARETELTTLMRDYDTLRESYRALLAKKEETQMAAELERRRVGETMRIVSGARIPAEPFSPNRPRTVATGALFGLTLALLFVGWREYQDGTLRTESEVRAALQVPVLASIPVIVNAADVRRTRLKRVAYATAAGLVVTGAIVLYFRWPVL